MQDESTLVHREHESSFSFEEVVAAFESLLGQMEGRTFQETVQRSRGKGEFEAHMRTAEGTSGFMLFQKLDHGAWMERVGLKARAVLYILGNPLIARTMIEYDPGVGLNVPVRVLIYEDPQTGTCRLAYDLPSSLMARLKNERVTAAAKKLDEKLTALAVSSTRAQF